jgi:hypothetical protein
VPFTEIARAMGVNASADAAQAATTTRRAVRMATGVSLPSCASARGSEDRYRGILHPANGPRSPILGRLPARERAPGRAPARVRCDWCGGEFRPRKWDSRTCESCANCGAPDQSRLEWRVYLRRARTRLRALGRLQPAWLAMLSRSTPGHDGHSSGARPRRGESEKARMGPTVSRSIGHGRLSDRPTYCGEFRPQAPPTLRERLVPISGSGRTSRTKVHVVASTWPGVCSKAMPTHPTPVRHRDSKLSVTAIDREFSRANCVGLDGRTD